MSDSFDRSCISDDELLKMFCTDDAARLRQWLEAKICKDISVESRVVDLFHRVFFPKAASTPGLEHMSVPDLTAANLKYTYGWLPTFHNSVRFLDAYYRDTARLRRENDGRVQFLVKYIKDIPDLVPRTGYALDFGAGDGQMIAGLANNGVRWVGVEQSSVARDLMRNQDYPGGGVHSIAPDLDTIVVSSFDLIVATDVIEHILDPVPILLRLAHLLCSGGRMFLSVPNGRVDRHIGHLHFFTSETLQHLLGRLVEEWGASNHAGRLRVDLVDYHRAGIAAVVCRVRA